jgi:phage tail-like protein
VKSYRIFRAWVSEYTALPELDANGNAVMFETIVLQNEGWERDPGTTEVRES